MIRKYHSSASSSNKKTECFFLPLNDLWKAATLINNSTTHFCTCPPAALTLQGANRYHVSWNDLKYKVSQLTHCIQMTPYGVGDLGHHWFMYWLVVWRHQAITWNSVDFSSMKFCGIHLREISLLVLKLLHVLLSNKTSFEIILSIYYQISQIMWVW